jgi:hypothetical protein
VKTVSRPLGFDPTIFSHLKVNTQAEIKDHCRKVLRHESLSDAQVVLDGLM